MRPQWRQFVLILHLLMVMTASADDNGNNNNNSNSSSTTTNNYQSSNSKNTNLFNITVPDSESTINPSSPTNDDSSLYPFLQYSLPSFLLLVKVQKQDSALMEFQNALQSTLEDHLQVFFQQKLETYIIGSPTKVRVELQGKLVWRELSASSSTDIATPYSSTTSTSTTSSPTQVSNSNNMFDTNNQSSVIQLQQQESQQEQQHQPQEYVVRNYEVSGEYDCAMILNYLNQNEEDLPRKNEVPMTQTLLTLFLIEAFQGKSYWDMVQRFVETPQLDTMQDVQITVLEDGFVPFNGASSSMTVDDDWYAFSNHHHNAKQKSQTDLSAGTVIGIAFSTVFVIGLIGIWAYLCCMVPDLFPTPQSNGILGKQRKHLDGSVSTDDACSITDWNSDSGCASADDNDDEENGSWMDVWAQQVTSIPLRDFQSVKRKKRVGQPTLQSFVRPARMHMSSLQCITEADNESVASTVASTQTYRYSDSTITPTIATGTKVRHHSKDGGKPKHNRLILSTKNATILSDNINLSSTMEEERRFEIQ